MTCEQCYQCKTNQRHICSNVRVCGIDRDGAYAEYVSIPEMYIWKLDPGIPPELAAIFDPIGNAVHTVLAGEVAGTTLAVVGCGPIGIAAIPFARASGATTVVGFDVSDYRLRMAEQMGADYVIDSSKQDTCLRCPATRRAYRTRSRWFDPVGVYRCSDCPSPLSPLTSRTISF
jgi:threonine 3-dehydrogenase